jgi:hypothetical protein
MHSRIESQDYPYKPNIYVRERPLHWFIMFICYLFIFLLILESIAFIVLGAWHLSIPRLQDVHSFSGAIYRREIGFGILLVILGSLGIFISIFGIIATISLRILLLRIVSTEKDFGKKTTTYLVCIMFMVFNDSWDYYWYYWYYICM